MNSLRMALFTLLSGIFLLNGCSPKYYQPPSLNVPMLYARNQAAISIAAQKERAELMAGYTLSDNTALLLNGGYFFPTDDEQGDGGSGFFAETGVGYYTNLSSYFTTDVYGIVGYGRVENHFPSTQENYPSTSATIHANLFRYGVQPSFCFHWRYVDAALSLRTTGLHYGGVEGDLVFDSTNQKSFLEQQSGMLLLEPALTLRVGYNFLKLQAQLGNSYNITHPNFPQDKSWFTVGLVYVQQF